MSRILFSLIQDGPSYSWTPTKRHKGETHSLGEEPRSPARSQPAGPATPRPVGDAMPGDAAAAPDWPVRGGCDVDWLEQRGRGRWVPRGGRALQPGELHLGS